MNPKIMLIHLKAFEENQKHQMGQQNANAWLTGQYMVEAIGVFLGKHHKYPGKPYELGEKHEPTMYELRDKIMARVKKLEQKEPEESVGDRFEPL